MNPDILFQIRCLSRFIYVVTEEEDRFLVQLHEALKKVEETVWVWNSCFGLVKVTDMIKDWASHSHQEGPSLQANQVLTEIYKQNARGRKLFFVITDPERMLSDPQIVRRFLNIAHQVHQDPTAVKVILFVGQRLFLPDKLQRYVEVVHDKGMTDSEVEDVVRTTCENFKQPVPAEAAKLFSGLSSWEVDSSITQAVIAARNGDNKAATFDPDFIRNYKKRALLKTQLVNYVDTSKYTFDRVGGNERFKEWAHKIRHTWTKEGQDFGLKPPRGLLCVGVWGCGKSLSVQCLGNAWGLPVIQLELGKLRASGVGESEGNIYRALRLIEGVAPCLVWIDEAEKSLSGGQSSSFSDAGTTSRMLGIFSTWVQETEAPVCIAMTANSLGSMPIEMINRMDERWFFREPAEDERVAILKIHIRQVNQDPNNFDLATLAQASKDLVGREIEQAIAAAMVESFVQGKTCLDQGILEQQLSSKPRIIDTMRDEIDEITNWVGYNEDLDEGIRARLASAKGVNPMRVVQD